mmetsp:Transcript_25647/g.65412  ORF Transcript_25647/g.65412 Transcript_25647/m.65412 type:complete len:205 (+) Transcript_25647:288-902(+)
MQCCTRACSELKHRPQDMQAGNSCPVDRICCSTAVSVANSRRHSEHCHTGSEDSDGPRRSALRRLSGDVCVLVMCLATASSALDARGCGSLAFLAVCENLHALPSTHLPAAKCLQGFVAFPKTCPNGQLLPFVQAPSAKSLHNLVPAPPPTSLEFTVGGKGGATCAKVQALPFVQSPWAKCLHNFEVAEAFAEALPFPAPTDGP